MSDALRPYGLGPARLLCPWDSPGKKTGVGCHALLQGDLPNPGIEPMSPVSPALQMDSLPTEPPGKPVQLHTQPTRKSVTLKVVDLVLIPAPQFTNYSKS